MREANIYALDLNLLIALKVLLEEKHVSRAAEKIGLSQPAMSRALGRLRHVLKDPLLVRSHSGLVLTARANELYLPLQAAFVEINQIISPPQADPATMRGEVIIATRDYEMVTVLPGLINCLSKQAPHLSLYITPLIGDNLDILERQQADFVICGTNSQSASLYRHKLFDENFICLVSSDNPLKNEKLTLKKYMSLKHCLVTISGFGPGVVDTTLATQGMKRTITVRVPHFLAAASMVAESDLIVTMPRRLGLILAQQKKVCALEPPLALPSFTIYSYWHARNQHNIQHKWIREVIRDVSETCAPS